MGNMSATDDCSRYECNRWAKWVQFLQKSWNYSLSDSTVKSLNCMFVISSASKYFGIKYFETYSLEHILEHENRFIWRFWFSTNYLVLDSSELSKDLTYSRSDRVERILELCLHKVSNKNYLLNLTFLFLHFLSRKL